jgi:hypothetical protein
LVIVKYTESVQKPYHRCTELHNEPVECGNLRQSNKTKWGKDELQRELTIFLSEKI